MDKPLLSVIVPSYNEEQNVEAFYFALRDVLATTHYRWEVIFVDDGSSDETLPLIQRLSTWHSSVKYVSFTRNFGKEAAILAGFQHAKGDCAVIIDADLQHPVELIGELLQGYEEGYDQVIACRDRKGESLVRSAVSRLYYKLINRVVDVTLENGAGDFRLLSRRAMDALLVMSEGNRFSKGLFSWIGFEQKTVHYENVSRKNGDSKWSASKLINYGIDGIISFNMKPLRLCLYAGGFILTIAMLYIFIMFIQILRTGVDVPGYFTMISAVLFLGGIQLVSLGIIGEYIGRIYNETKRRPHYLVKETNSSREKHYEHVQ
ncbi:glycosyltransferase family 2 protein [Shouchella shacheensis]|uniref:glycosyltransferase family 2 protein n=1 Tax=Shouchella shacheensis TaxID=1649580 RepID=UPI00073FDE48|nr:glycosyltransferase family 2 protein [Shouchella shacheensis]